MPRHVQFLTGDRIDAFVVPVRARCRASLSPEGSLSLSLSRKRERRGERFHPSPGGSQIPLVSLASRSRGRELRGAKGTGGGKGCDRGRCTRGHRDVARNSRPLEVIDLRNQRDSVTPGAKRKEGRRDGRREARGNHGSDEAIGTKRKSDRMDFPRFLPSPSLFLSIFECSVRAEQLIFTQKSNPLIVFFFF